MKKMKYILTKALDRLLQKGAQLLKIDANERSISHRLAMHLQCLLPDWDVDCEYNRNLGITKRLDFFSPCRTTSTDDTNGTTVFPDIIVHHRNSEINRLVVEIKKTTSTRNDDWDKEKLKKFCEQLGYEHAVFVKLKTGGDDIGVKEINWIK